MQNRDNIFKVIVALILIAGVVVRLPNFSLPPIDAHPMRQTDTESVAFNFAFTDHNILYPQTSLIRPYTNSNAYFFLEFPVYEYLIGILYMLFGWHIELPRLLNLLFYLISGASLYYFVKNLFNKVTAAFSLFLFTFLPASIFFLGHAIHPDVFAVTTLITSMSAYLKWKDSKNVWFFALAVVLYSLSVATRPFILISLPAYLYLLFLRKSKVWEYIFLAIGSMSIFGGWKVWQEQFKLEADYSWENWIFSGRDKLFKKEFFVDQLILKNVIGEELGKVTSVLFGVSVLVLLKKITKQYIFLLIWLIGIPVYWLLVPGGNITHQYYANIYLIPIIITTSEGMFLLFNHLYKKTVFLSYIVLVIVGALVIYNGVRTSSYFFASSVTEDDLVIAND